MVTSQTRGQQFNIRGTRLAVYTSGSGDPAVVFISGLGDPASVWEPVVGRLGGLTATVSYDRAGIGESGDLGDRVSSTQPASWAANQLRELLEQINVNQRVVLVGHSLGGQIADAFAVRWPEVVAGLVLVDAVDPELNLVINPPRPVLDDAIPTRVGEGWKWDIAASATEYAATRPAEPPPTAVIASAIWRWFQAKQPALYRPLSLAEVDQRWQLAQLQYARRWSGELVVANEAGHRLHEDAPELLAMTVAAVVDAARCGIPLRLDAAQVHESGGSVRPIFPVG